MNRTRLLALARKVIDPSSPEPEQVESGRALAKELIKLLTDGKTLLITKGDAEAESVMNVAEQEAADRANAVVQQAVRKAEAKERMKSEPEPEVAWVDFDLPNKPPGTVGVPFAENAFGRKPRARR